MKKSFKILLAAVAVFMVLAVTATLTLSIITMMKVNAINSQTSGEAAAKSSPDEADDFAAPADSGETKDKYEDGVVIAENYTIRSTKAISDAYLSGDASRLDSDDRETLDLASKVLKEIINDGMTDFEKECAVYDWICENIGLDDGGMVLIQDDPEAVCTPHGVLKHKKAVCVGYATTFRLFMEMLDIQCHVVPASERGHSWDLVQLDGAWYHVDAYSVSAGDHYSLNLPDEMMSQDWDRDHFPAAESYDCCWLYRNAKESTDVYTLPASLKEAIDNRETYLSLLYTPESDDDEAIADAILKRLSAKVGFSEEYMDVISFIDYHVATVDGKVLACAHITYYDQAEYDPYSIPDYLDEDKINDAIERVFGELDMGY